MRPSRVLVLTAALSLGAAVSVLPVEVASAQAPSTTVLIPANNATVSGTAQVLDAFASSGVTQVQYEITGGTLSDSVIATGTPTYYGWLAQWNTTSVPNGTYNLQSVASAGGVSGTSAPVSVTVDNLAPSTTIIIPSAGSSLSGTSSLLDATASAKVTSVTYELSGGTLSDDVIATGTPTYYGWLAQWNTTSVPNGTYNLQSVAAYAGGVSGTSSSLTINVNNPPPSTTVILPESDGTLNPGTGFVFDASASPGVTQVLIELVNQEGTDIYEGWTATLTIYGWIVVVPPCSSCITDYPVPISGLFAIESVASYSGGVSGKSPIVPVTIIDYTTPPP